MEFKIDCLFERERGWRWRSGVGQDRSNVIRPLSSCHKNKIRASQIRACLPASRTVGYVRLFRSPPYNLNWQRERRWWTLDGLRESPRERGGGGRHHHRPRLG